LAIARQKALENHAADLELRHPRKSRREERTSALRSPTEGNLKKAETQSLIKGKIVEQEQDENDTLDGGAGWGVRNREGRKWGKASCRQHTGKRGTGIFEEGCLPTCYWVPR